MDVEPTERRKCSALLEAKKAQRAKMKNTILEQDSISLFSPSLCFLSWGGVGRSKTGKNL